MLTQKSFSQTYILDFIDAGEVLKQKNVSSSPTEYIHLLYAVQLDNEGIGWGLYTVEQYRDTICRPSDGDRTPNLKLNF